MTLQVFPNAERLSGSERLELIGDPARLLGCGYGAGDERTWMRPCEAVAFGPGRSGAQL